MNPFHSVEFTQFSNLCPPTLTKFSSSFSQLYKENNYLSSKLLKTKDQHARSCLQRQIDANIEKINELEHIQLTGQTSAQTRYAELGLQEPIIGINTATGPLEPTCPCFGLTQEHMDGLAKMRKVADEISRQSPNYAFYKSNAERLLNANNGQPPSINAEYSQPPRNAQSSNYPQPSNYAQPSTVASGADRFHRLSLTGNRREQEQPLASYESGPFPVPSYQPYYQSTGQSSGQTSGQSCGQSNRQGCGQPNCEIVPRKPTSMSFEMADREQRWIGDQALNEFSPETHRPAKRPNIYRVREDPNTGDIIGDPELIPFPEVALYHEFNRTHLVQNTQNRPKERYEPFNISRRPNSMNQPTQSTNATNSSNILNLATVLDQPSQLPDMMNQMGGMVQPGAMNQSMNQSMNQNAPEAMSAPAPLYIRDPADYSERVRTMYGMDEIGNRLSPTYEPHPPSQFGQIQQDNTGLSQNIGFLQHDTGFTEDTTHLDRYSTGGF